MASPLESAPAFSGLVDLAAERIGGKALLASDEFFAGKENLLKPGRGIFIPEKYTDRGKWMDGWETRRKRTPGNDWCIIRLGFAGVIKGVDIDTNHFLGNNPAFASIDACAAGDEEILTGGGSTWKEILPRCPLRPGSQNLFAVADSRLWTHVRLNIFPDGGVARLRVFGEVVPDRPNIALGEMIDLAFIGNGGKVVAASDMFFGNTENLIMPGKAATMGDGWETKRRRGPGNDWAIVKLGRAGRIGKIEVDTDHFKGNYPDRCSLDALYTPEAVVDALTWQQFQWSEVVPPSGLLPDSNHLFEVHGADPYTHVRLNIFPDGGVSRLKVWCHLADPT